MIQQKLLHDDQKAADEVGALIDKIYVQERTDTTGRRLQSKIKHGTNLQMLRKNW